MSKGNEWVDKRLGKATQTHPLVTEALVERMKDLLLGQLSEKQLSPKVLGETASKLIADITTTPPHKAEDSHED
ncbi:MAG TPA: hypothetical protein ENI12_03410 [Nitrospirae bacterium]|nr:hypothetical protein [Nitrospirota bacterium]